MVYQYTELEDATDKFSPEKKIGKGGFGVVYRGVLRHVSVAVKVLSDVSCIDNRVQLCNHVCLTLV